MRIIVLDGYATNPDRQEWQPLHDIGECIIYDRTAEDEVITRAKDADIILTSKMAMDESIMKSLPALRYIGVMATGYNVVDIEAARKHNITVTNVPAYSTQAVAQGTFALLLQLTNHVGHYDETTHGGQWSQSKDFCYSDIPIIELAGLTMGIIGFGGIGRAVAKRAHAFGMNIIAHTRTQPESETGIPVQFCTLEELLAQADIISLHCPLTPQTRNLINASTLNLMKQSALLLNTSRGALIDETALADALNRGRIAGAGLDVLTSEPPQKENPLLNARNCIITPHNSWATATTRRRLVQKIAENIRCFIEGQPVNVVSG